jgi:phosphoserine aminotransferase
VQFYAVIDASRGFYSNHVAREYRSRTSIPFRILGGDAELEARFSRDAVAVCALSSSCSVAFAQQASRPHGCPGT